MVLVAKAQALALARAKALAKAQALVQVLAKARAKVQVLAQAQVLVQVPAKAHLLGALAKERQPRVGKLLPRRRLPMEQLPLRQRLQILQGNRKVKQGRARVAAARCFPYPTSSPICPSRKISQLNSPKASRKSKQQNDGPHANLRRTDERPVSHGCTWLASSREHASLRSRVTPTNSREHANLRSRIAPPGYRAPANLRIRVTPPSSRTADGRQRSRQSP